MIRLVDAEARELACREFVRPVAIEAGAGTGKTRTLVARIGTWLLGPGWERAADELSAERAAVGGSLPTAAEIAARAADGIVAITFTDAAAAEMASRVDKLFGQASTRRPIDDLDARPPGVLPEALAQRSAALLASSSRLRISTIHGFCHRLLAEWPLDAGVHPGFRVDADGEATAQLATGILLARLRASDAALVDLLADGVDPPELLEVLRELVDAGVGAEELARDPFDGAALGRRFEALEAAIAELLTRAAPLRSGHKVSGILDGLSALEGLGRSLTGAPRSQEGLVAIAGEVESRAEDARKILGGWAKGDFGKTEEKILAPDALTGLAAAAASLSRQHRALSELDPLRLALARRALSGPLAELAARLRAEGIVSFGELLERGVRLLSDRPAVRDRVRRGMRQLLVDEFQDTDRRQCAMLRALALDASDVPPPGLFLVGDPKQSIYGWRNADLAAYTEFLAELAAAGGEAARLEVNFRSAPPILSEVEKMLAPVLREEPGIQAPFQLLRPSPARSADTGFVRAGRAPVEYWDSSGGGWSAGEDDTTAARSTEIEARAIARDVRELVAQGAARWKDFALLLRARGDLETYLDELRRAGVPYVVQKDRSYYRRREVVDMAAAVRAILDPDDLLALVAFLRSPFVGVPDAAWLPLWRAGFPAAMSALEGEHGLTGALSAVARAAAEPASGPVAPKEGDWAESLSGAIEAVARLRAEYRTLSASEWIERMRARLLPEPIAASRFLGRFGLANLERLFSTLEQRLTGEPDPGRALAALRLAIAEEAPAEEARPPEQEGDAVAVMTIHTAKGLEFRHVYLAQAQKRGGGPAEGTLPLVGVGAPDSPREMVLFGAPSPGWRDHEAQRRRVAAAEVARLLYVASTRAIDRLIVLGRWPDRDGRKAPAGTAPSFADLLSARLAAAPVPHAENIRSLDQSGTLWRLADEGKEASPPMSTVLVSSSGAGAPRTTGRRRSADARARSRRQRFAPASRLAAIAPPPAEPTRADAGRDRGRALGVALHRALEQASLQGSDDARWRQDARTAFAAELGEKDLQEEEALESALDRLAASVLWKRLADLQPQVLARELPLLASAGADVSSLPTDGILGTLDLLYRDPGTSRLVVADFKSDAVTDDAGIAERIETYRPQLELYGRAVKEALALETPPRLELWLLDLDRIVEIPPGDSG